MKIKIKQFSKKSAVLGATIALLLGLLSVTPMTVSAQNQQQQAKPNVQNENFFGGAKGGYQCGKGDNAVKTRINFGCLGDSAPGSRMSPIEDLIYAFIRFLSYGVGIVLIGSMIWAGIQYSTSEGNPEATQSAKNRIRDTVIGLFIYLFAFALVQYLVPGGLFK
jgi:Type IV secretion system pilin